MNTPPTIDGLTPSALVTPLSAAELADTLAQAAADGLKVAPIGGGTALALGNPPERVDLALSTLALNGVLDYEPSDLVLSVAAGARFADVQALLAGHGQTLPLDPPGDAAATIGGLIATALAGPRRLGSGTLRDLLIGIAVAHPAGIVTKSGGMVVKNVTGFDLPRLYHGSLGTLGVIVSANLKVLPRARAEATLIARVVALDDALAAADRVRASRLRPVALEAALVDGAWFAAVRLEGRPATVATLAAEAAGLLESDTETLHGTDSAAWWRRYVAHQAVHAAPDEALLRFAVRPRATADLVRAVLRAVDGSGAIPRAVMASVGVGTVIVRAALDPEGAAATLSSLTATISPIADHVTVIAAPPAWKRGLDVWGGAPQTLDVMRALKSHFDPERVLNPGRFAGRI